MMLACVTTEASAGRPGVLRSHSRAQPEGDALGVRR